MTLDYSEATRDARGAAQGILDRIANRLGSNARSDVVFGEAVTQGDVTVIPVCKVRWGFGGGAGAGSDDGKEGEDYGEGGGGGGGLSAVPVGFIELSNGKAEFKPIKDLPGLWPLVLASAIGAWIALRGLRGLFH